MDIYACQHNLALQKDLCSLGVSRFENLKSCVDFNSQKTPASRSWKSTSLKVPCLETPYIAEQIEGQGRQRRPHLIPLHKFQIWLFRVEDYDYLGYGLGCRFSRSMAFVVRGAYYSEAKGLGSSGSYQLLVNWGLLVTSKNISGVNKSSASLEQSLLTEC